MDVQMHLYFGDRIITHRYNVQLRQRDNSPESATDGVKQASVQWCNLSGRYRSHSMLGHAIYLQVIKNVRRVKQYVINQEGFENIDFTIYATFSAEIYKDDHVQYLHTCILYWQELDQLTSDGDEQTAQAMERNSYIRV